MTYPSDYAGIKKILPLGKSPVISYLHHAYPLSIVAINDAYLPWFHCHYVQLHSPKIFENVSGGQRTQFNFYRVKSLLGMNAPWLDIQSIDRCVLDSKNICEFVEQCLCQGYYVQLYVDEFYIPDRIPYRRRNFVHEILIYGYEKKDQIFFSIGYNKFGNFDSTIIPFDDLQAGFEISAHFQDYDYLKYICLFGYRSEIEFDFDLILLIEQLRDYLYSENTSEKYRLIVEPVSGLFGLETYQYLQSYMRSLITQNSSIDIRLLYVLWEHKKCMLWRIKYLEDHGYLKKADGFYSNYSMIEKKARIIRMMALKHSKTRENKIIKQISDYLNKLKKEEKTLLTRMYHLLQAGV